MTNSSWFWETDFYKISIKLHYQNYETNYLYKYNKYIELQQYVVDKNICTTRKWYENHQNVGIEIFNHINKSIKSCRLMIIIHEYNNERHKFVLKKQNVSLLQVLMHINVAPETNHNIRNMV